MTSPARDGGAVDQEAAVYVPPHFALTDPDRLLALMRAHPFATVVGIVDGAFEAAHLPLLVDRDGDRFVVHGHVARPNRLRDAERALAVFAGPHAYVSAAWYDEPDTVPTWNYLAVHAEGPLRWLHDEAQQRALFARLAATFDGDGGSAWRDRLSEAVYGRLLGGIAWFRIDCATVVGKAKLAQNHAPARRARTIAALRAVGDEPARAVAEAMERWPDG